MTARLFEYNICLEARNEKKEGEERSFPTRVGSIINSFYWTAHVRHSWEAGAPLTGPAAPQPLVS